QRFPGLSTACARTHNPYGHKGFGGIRGVIRRRRAAAFPAKFPGAVDKQPLARNYPKFNSYSFNLNSGLIGDEYNYRYFSKSYGMAWKLLTGSGPFSRFFLSVRNSYMSYNRRFN